MAEVWKGCLGGWYVTVGGEHFKVFKWPWQEFPTPRAVRDAYEHGVRKVADHDGEHARIRAKERELTASLADDKAREDTDG